jgi:hypothetical protein
MKFKPPSSPPRSAPWPAAWALAQTVRIANQGDAQLSMDPHSLNESLQLT